MFFFPSLLLSDWFCIAFPIEFISALRIVFFCVLGSRHVYANDSQKSRNREKEILLYYIYRRVLRFDSLLTFFCVSLFIHHLCAWNFSGSVCFFRRRREIVYFAEFICLLSFSVSARVRGARRQRRGCLCRWFAATADAAIATAGWVKRADQCVPNAHRRRQKRNNKKTKNIFRGKCDDGVDGDEFRLSGKANNRYLRARRPRLFRLSRRAAHFIYCSSRSVRGRNHRSLCASRHSSRSISHQCRRSLRLMRAPRTKPKAHAFRGGCEKREPGKQRQENELTSAPSAGDDIFGISILKDGKRSNNSYQMCSTNVRICCRYLSHALCDIPAAVVNGISNLGLFTSPLCLARFPRSVGDGRFLRLATTSLARATRAKRNPTEERNSHVAASLALSNGTE